jgi:hypothetical protein
MENMIYTPIWSKYRPAILQLMVAAAGGTQQYKLSAHEFKGMNPKEKGGYAFILQAHKGRAQNNIKKSIVAQNLLSVLEMSKKASELMSIDSYEFKMDKQFTLSVTKLEPVES